MLFHRELCEAGSGFNVGKKMKKIKLATVLGLIVVMGNLAATTQGEFIEENSPIKVIAIKNNQLIVEKVS